MQIRAYPPSPPLADSADRVAQLPLGRMNKGFVKKSLENINDNGLHNMQIRAYPPSPPLADSADRVAQLLQGRMN